MLMELKLDAYAIFISLQCNSDFTGIRFLRLIKKYKKGVPSEKKTGSI